MTPNEIESPRHGNPPPPDPRQSSSTTSLATVPVVGMAVNASLAGLKIVAGVFGNSYALIADGIESTSDIVTSLVVWGGLRVAETPANEKHPYGYGKAESLAGVIASLAILIAAAIIAIQSVREILTPHHLPHWSTLFVLVFVVVIKESLARWTSHIGAEADSISLQADAWHHRADALSSLAAFVGISVACAIIGISVLRLLKLTARDILDVAPPKSFEAQVRQLATEIDGVIAVEKCRIRKSGTTYFVEIHIEVDGQSTVEEGHRIGGRVRSRLRQSNLRIEDAFVHIEPYSARS